jgi:hypothetical protein
VIKFIYDNRILPLAVIVLWIVAIRTLHFYWVLDITWPPMEQRGLFQYLLNVVNQNAVLSFVLSTMVILVEGLILGQICWEFNILDKPGYSVLFFFSSISSLFSASLVLNYVILGSFLMVIGLYFLYKFLKGNYQRLDLFTAAIFMGFAMLFVPEMYWSIVFLVILVLLFKAAEAGDVLVILFGILLPYYLISSIGYLFSTKVNFTSSIQIWRSQAIWKPLVSSVWNLDLIIILNLILVSFFGVVKVFGSYYRYNVEARRSRLAMGVIAIFSLLIWVLRYTYYREYLIVLAVPLSVYTANLFQMERYPILVKLLFWLLVAVLVCYPLYA